MIGAEFIVHGEPQKVKLDIVDDKFPGVSGFGSDSFELRDEWYALKNFADNLHVILAHDTSTFAKKTGGNKCYDRPNFPETWIRMHGKGRVFYTSMGHFEDVWENPRYQGLLLGALTVITGRVDTDMKPNISTVTPHYQTLPK
jgi:type 1 glutamine amidotransferase